MEKCPFVSRLTKRPRYYSNPGSRMANDYQIEIDKRGHKSLHKVGEHDIWEEIQSYKEECSIDNILARAAAGDPNALNQRKGFYADITDSPKTLAEAQNNILKLKQGFEKLPAEIREKFDNSKEKFVMEFGTNTWIDKMGFNTNEKATETGNVDFVPGTSEASNNILTPEEGK